MEWVPEFNFQLSVKLGGSIFQKACFLEIKEYVLNTSLKQLFFQEFARNSTFMIHLGGLHG